MSENFNSDVNTSSAIEGNSPENASIFQDREKTGETEVVSTSQDLKRKEDPGTVNTSQNIEKVPESELVSTFQVREKTGETKVVSTSEDLKKKEDPVAVDSSQDINKKVGSEKVSTCQGREKIEEVVSTSQDLEKKKEPEAVNISKEIERLAETEEVTALEASEDSFSEGSIHIRVSEPFTLTEDLELYLSEGNSEDETENFIDCLSEPTMKGQNEEVSSEQEVFNGEVNPVILEVSSQGTPVASSVNSAVSENLISLIKPCSVTFTDLGSKDKSFSKPDQVADTEKNVYIHQPKRRGRPPKSVVKIDSAGSEDSSNNKYKPPKRSQKGIEQPVNINFCDIKKTKNISINSFDKTVTDEKRNLAAEEPSSSTGHAFKRNTVNILTPKDLINQTLAKLMSGNSKSEQKTLGKGEKVVISDIRKVSSIDKSGKVEISEQSISDDSNLNRNSRPNKSFEVNIKKLEKASTKCDTTEKKALPAKELFTSKESNIENNSEQTNADGINISINNSPLDDCKRQINLLKSSSKSQCVSVITPRELINRTLEKLTCRKFPQAKQKTPVEEDNSKSSNRTFLQTKQNTAVEEENSKSSNLSIEQLIEKNKKEEMQRELINRTLAKLTGKLPKSKEEKSNEIKTNELLDGPCMKKNKEYKVSRKQPSTSRVLIPRESKSRARIFIPIKQRRKTKGKVSSAPNECKKDEETQKDIPVQENVEITNQMAMPQNENCKINIQMDEPSSKISSALKTVTLTDSDLKNKKPIRQNKTTLEEKDKFCSTSSYGKKKKASPKTLVKGEKLCIENQDQKFESVVLPSEKCLIKNQLDEKNYKSCPPLHGVTHAEPQLERKKRPKSRQFNSKKVFKNSKLCKKTQFAKNIRGNPLEKNTKKDKLKSNKQLVLSLNKKCKRKAQMDGKKSTSFKIAIANKESNLRTGKILKIDETISEDQQQEKCSNSSLTASIDQVKYKEQIKANPRVCLVDCKTFGLCATNEEVVRKIKFLDKNDLTLKQVTCIPNQTDDHLMVDSGEYFTQLELSPSSKSDNEPLKSLLTSPTEEKSGVEKGSIINETVIINDGSDHRGYGEPCSTSTSLPAQNLEGSKLCSFGSSQSLGSTEKLPASKSPRFNNVPLKSLSVSPTEKKSKVEKGSKINETVIINDGSDHRGYGEPCSTSSSLPAHNLEGSKLCSFGLSQNLVSTENLPASKSPKFNNVPLKSLTTSPTEKKSRVEKCSKINETVIINDGSDLRGYGEPCSTSATLPAHNLEGSKLCSFGSSQNLVSTENLPASKSPRFNNVPLKSLSTSLTEKKSKVDKGSKINEIIVIDDDDNDDHHGYLCSTSASLPALNQEGSKQCSIGSSQKSVSIENLATKQSPRYHVRYKRYCNSAPRKQYSSTEKAKRAFSLSPQVQMNNINHAVQYQSPIVAPPQFVLETSNFLTPVQYQSPVVASPQFVLATSNFLTLNSVQIDNNFITTKLKEGVPTGDLSQNQQPKTSHLSSNVIKQSSDNIVRGPLPHNALEKKGIPPLMPSEMLTQWTKIIPSDSHRITSDQSLNLPPNIPISAPVLPNKNLPVASVPNYYFTPLFVLDGEKVVPVNAANSPQYTIGNYNTPNSQLKSGHKSCKSTITKTPHSQIIIDSNTLKPFPRLDLTAVSASSVVSPSVASPKLDLLNTNQSLFSVNGKIKGSLGSFTVSSTQQKCKNLEPTTKRKHAGLDGARAQNELHKNTVHCSSSTYSNFESDHLTASKRRKYQTHLETKYVSADQGSTKKPEPPAKQKIHSNRGKNLNECGHHEEVSVSSTYPSIGCDESTSPKRRKYQEHLKTTNHMPALSSERMSEVSSSNCFEPDPNDENLCSLSGNESTFKKEMPLSLPQIQNKQSNYFKNVNKQSKGKEENLSPSSSIKNKGNMSISISTNYENNQSGSQKPQNKQISTKNDSLQSKNKLVKSKEKNVCTLDGNKSVAQEEMPVSLSTNLNKQSDSLSLIMEDKQVNSKKKDCLRNVNKRVKSKEEDLEECLDGVPPFIQEVLKCENIRDGFDNRDLIFVLSLLPDIEEMTSTQRVIFQSRAVKIINDVFANKKLQSVIKGVKT